MATIEERYVQKFSKSMDWHERGTDVFAGGVTHQTRFTSPFAVYIDHADGPFKYDVDDNQIIDYVMGHGALLFGHAHPLLVDLFVIGDLRLQHGGPRVDAPDLHRQPHLG